MLPPIESNTLSKAIGQDGWYFRDGKRAYYDQQPEDAASAIEALITAYEITSNEIYKDRAKIIRIKCYTMKLLAVVTMDWVVNRLILIRAQSQRCHIYWRGWRWNV